ncbi:MAG TPA: transglutaminase family protein [Phycisphaerales bacterium]|nr:transglutaminase family protein [Phycisphaerales bacterium]
MLLEIEHHLRFDYSVFVRESHMEVRVEPRTQSGQVLHEFELAVGPHTQPTRHEDWLGNALHWFSITDFHERVEVVAKSLVETSPPAVQPTELADQIDGLTDSLNSWDFLQFGGPIIRSERLEQLAISLDLLSCELVGSVIERISRSLHSYIVYQPLVTNFLSTSDESIEKRGGVCQDFAHVTLALLRLCGIACRYVNGYLHVDPTNKPAESHAWVEVLSPSHGWVGFDPTHRCAPDEGHVVVAYGRHYNDVPPNRGIFRGAATERLHAEVRTTPVERRERPHVTQPVVMEVPVFTEPPDQASGLQLRSDEAAAQQQQQ